MQFQRSVRHGFRLRAAFIGPAGSGKTYTALTLASFLGKRIAVIDTERGSSNRYANKFEFDALKLTSYKPENYIEGIGEAVRAGYDVLVIDSLSHAWMGKDGLLEFVDKQARASQSGNTFGAWRDATPLHNKMVDAILGAELHIIVTMRSKMEYVQERDEKTGKTRVRKIGLQPVQRDGLEYEFDITADLTTDLDLIVSKTRCEELSGQVYRKAGKEFADIIKAWIGSDPVPTPAPQSEPTPTPAAATATRRNNAPAAYWAKYDTLYKEATKKGVKRDKLADSASAQDIVTEAGELKRLMEAPEGAFIASVETLSRLSLLAERLKLDKGDLTMDVQTRYGVSAATQLTEEQAQAMIAEFKERVRQADAREALAKGAAE